MPGFLAVLLAKMAGLGAVKTTIATATAALTLAVAGGATGVLPLPGGHAGTGVVATAAVAQSLPADVPPPSTGLPEMPGMSAAIETSVSAAATGAEANVSVAAPMVAAAATVPVVPDIPLPTLPSLPAIPPCVANLIPAVGIVPDPFTLVAQLPACILSVVTAHLPLDTIQSVIGSFNLPIDIVGCLSSVLGSVPGFVGGNLSGLPQLLAACLPTGAVPGIGSIPGMGSIPDMGSIPFFGSIPFMGLIPGFGTGQ